MLECPCKKQVLKWATQYKMEMKVECPWKKQVLKWTTQYEMEMKVELIF